MPQSQTSTIGSSGGSAQIINSIPSVSLPKIRKSRDSVPRTKPAVRLAILSASITGRCGQAPRMELYSIDECEHEACQPLESAHRTRGNLISTVPRRYLGPRLHIHYLAIAARKAGREAALNRDGHIFALTHLRDTVPIAELRPADGDRSNGFVNHKPPDAILADMTYNQELPTDVSAQDGVASDGEWEDSILDEYAEYKPVNTQSDQKGVTAANQPPQYMPFATGHDCSTRPNSTEGVGIAS